jgi:hypothetical protein
MGEGNENLVYISPWDFKSSFAFRKILRRGTSGFTSHQKGRCAADFYRSLKSISLAGIEAETLGSSGKHTNHYTTKETVWQETRQYWWLPEMSLLKGN